MAKYYIRPRKIDDPKKWLGPFDAEQLKEYAERRLFSKELHEYSEDRETWISARQIWPTLFPKKAKSVNSLSQPMPIVGHSPSAGAGTTSAADVDLATVDLETADWYCACDGVQHGPFTISQLRELATRGQLQPTDLIWCPNLGSEWVEAQTDRSLFPSAASAFFQVDESRSATRSGKAPPLAVASFVMGLLGTSLLPGIGSIPAIIFGHVCLSQMKLQKSPKTGKWMAITGIALGYTTIVVLLVGITVYLSLA